MVSEQQLQDRKTQLQKQVEQLLANLNAVHGAIALIDDLLKPQPPEPNITANPEPS